MYDWLTENPRSREWYSSCLRDGSLDKVIHLLHTPEQEEAFRRLVTYSVALESCESWEMHLFDDFLDTLNLIWRKYLPHEERAIDIWFSDEVRKGNYQSAFPDLRQPPNLTRKFATSFLKSILRADSLTNEEVFSWYVQARFLLAQSGPDFLYYSDCEELWRAPYGIEAIKKTLHKSREQNVASAYVRWTTILLSENVDIEAVQFQYYHSKETFWSLSYSEYLRLRQHGHDPLVIIDLVHGTKISTMGAGDYNVVKSLLDSGFTSFQQVKNLLKNAKTPELDDHSLGSVSRLDWLVQHWQGAREYNALPGLGDQNATPSQLQRRDELMRQWRTYARTVASCYYASWLAQQLDAETFQQMCDPFAPKDVSVRVIKTHVPKVLRPFEYNPDLMFPLAA